MKRAMGLSATSIKIRAVIPNGSKHSIKSGGGRQNDTRGVLTFHIEHDSIIFLLYASYWKIEDAGECGEKEY